MVSVLTRAKKCAKISFVFEKDAGVAQSVEQLIRNHQVAKLLKSCKALKTLHFLKGTAPTKPAFVSCLCLIPEKIGF